MTKYICTLFTPCTLRVPKSWATFPVKNPYIGKILQEKNHEMITVQEADVSDSLIGSKKNFKAPYPNEKLRDYNISKGAAYL